MGNYAGAHLLVRKIMGFNMCSRADNKSEWGERDWETGEGRDGE